MKETYEVYELTYELLGGTTGRLLFTSQEQAELEAEDIRNQDKEADITIEQITVADLDEVWEG